MNGFGLMAREHWAKCAPVRTSALQDPQRFFAELGEQVAAQVAATCQDLERSIPTGLGYLEQVAALQAVRKQAEEIVLADLVYSVPTEPSGLVEELEMMLGRLPDAATLTWQLADLAETVQQEAAEQGFSEPILTEQQETARDRWEALLSLVDDPRPAEQLSEAQLRDRILALGPFVPDQQ